MSLSFSLEAWSRQKLDQYLDLWILVGMGVGDIFKSRQLFFNCGTQNFVQCNFQVNYMTQIFVQGNYGTKNVSWFNCQVNY